MSNFKNLQAQLAYTFKNEALLVQALTHTSYGHETFPDKAPADRDNERLEFLGDAILDVVVSDVLLALFPQHNEGQLSKMRAATVNERTLAAVARSLKLQEYILLGKGESLTGGAQKASIISSAFEALIAAIYLDGGFSTVYPIVKNLFENFFKDESSAQVLLESDPKTRLQEIAQAKFKATPTYHLISSEGPDHSKVFSVEVRIQNQVISQAVGYSKKDAEQNAARSAISQVIQ